MHKNLYNSIVNPVEPIKKIYHINDISMKYINMAQSKRQHRYLGLPGEHKVSLPQEVVYPDMEIRRADEFYLNNENMLFNLEEETGPITDETLRKISRYVIFGAYMYTDQVYVAILCHQKPEKEFMQYKISPALTMNVHFIYFPPEELHKKYENLINKVEHNIILTEMEALDMAFISKFIPKNEAEDMVKSLADLFSRAKIEDKKLEIDVAAILGAMILKNVEDVDEQKRLMEMINMMEYESEMQKIVYEEFGDELKTMKKELQTSKETIKSKDENIKNLQDSNRKLRSALKQLLNEDDSSTIDKTKIQKAITNFEIS